MSELMEFDLQALIMHVGIIAFSGVGIVQWCKNYVKPCDIREKRKKYATISFLVALIMAIVQSRMVPDWLTFIINLFVLGLSAQQIAHEYIMTAFQNFVKGATYRVAGSPTQTTPAKKT
jgi:hypothetical protein